MHLPKRRLAVRPVSALALLAIVAVPFALATGGGDIVTTGGVAGPGFDAPQLYCALALATTHSGSQPLACDAYGAGTGVTVLRAHVLGPAGHVNAYAEDAGTPICCPQLGSPVDCRVSMSVPPLTPAIGDQLPATRTCAALLSFGGITTRFGLHALVDGPAGTIVEAQLERMEIPLP
jgi:hypothetical protein